MLQSINPGPTNPAQLRFFQLETGNTGSVATSTLRWVAANTRFYHGTDDVFAVEDDEDAGTRVRILMPGRYLVRMGAAISDGGTLRFGVMRNPPDNYTLTPAVSPVQPNILASAGPFSPVGGGTSAQVTAVLSVFPSDLATPLRVAGVAAKAAGGAPAGPDILPGAWMILDFLGPVNPTPVQPL